MKDKRFISYFITIILLVVFINIVVLEYFSQKVLVKADNLLGHFELAKSKIKSTDVIALGDSHISYGININSDKYFNLAFPSDNTVIMYAKLRSFFEKGLRPKLIILQADSHIFTSYREKFDYSKYASVFDKSISEEISMYYPHTEITIQRDLLGYPLYQMRTDIASNIYPVFLRYLLDSESVNLSKNVTLNGTVINNGDWLKKTKLERIEKSRKRVKEQFPTGQSQFTPILEDYYLKIIQFCHDNNIKIVMVKMPLSSEYIQSMDIAVSQKMQGYFKALAEKNSIKILDYSDAFNDNSFANEDHLNIRSSSIFGKNIKSDICKDNNNKHDVKNFCDLYLK